jgi:hypothetical protein
MFIKRLIMQQPDQIRFIVRQQNYAPVHYWLPSTSDSNRNLINSSITKHKWRFNDNVNVWARWDARRLHRPTRINYFLVVAATTSEEFN